MNCKMDQVCDYVISDDEEKETKTKEEEKKNKNKKEEEEEKKEQKDISLLPLSCQILENIYEWDKLDYTIPEKRMTKCSISKEWLSLDNHIPKMCKKEKLNNNKLLFAFIKQQFSFITKQAEASFYLDKITDFTKRLIDLWNVFTRMKIKIWQVFNNILDCDC